MRTFLREKGVPFVNPWEVKNQVLSWKKGAIFGLNLSMVDTYDMDCVSLQSLARHVYPDNQAVGSWNKAGVCPCPAPSPFIYLFVVLHVFPVLKLEFET